MLSPLLDAAMKSHKLQLKSLVFDLVDEEVEVPGTVNDEVTVSVYGCFEIVTVITGEVTKAVDRGEIAGEGVEGVEESIMLKQQ